MATQMRLGFEQMRRLPLAMFALVYTVITGGPLLWVTLMSLRTTAEIFKNPYGIPSPAHWEKFVDAWTKANYSTYFWNSAVVVVISVVLVTVIGAMAAHCLARKAPRARSGLKPRRPAEGTAGARRGRR